MAIEKKDLVERLYEGKDCVSFVYYVPVEETDQKLRVKFRKGPGDLWIAQAQFAFANYQITVYESPTAILGNATLEQTAARCLYSLRQDVARDCQQLSLVDFAIGDAIEGM